MLSIPEMREEIIRLEKFPQNHRISSAIDAINALIQEQERAIAEANKPPPTPREAAEALIKKYMTAEYRAADRGNDRGGPDASQIKAAEEYRDSVKEEIISAMVTAK